MSDDTINLEAIGSLQLNMNMGKEKKDKSNTSEYYMFGYGVIYPEMRIVEGEKEGERERCCDVVPELALEGPAI